ncbi:trifunctional histidinol dehydrogenase [Lobosporangium transversale]|uniref:Histidine biosynthesis trifunctional protein n=1 Tax=Lobosporangium transversale TaxID=64571 RepID=A0A1Y2GWL6_9FUNG|nr:histidinol dehydrogenase-domain-containing protein [Lobosporangium transversale]KAF9916269.1 trifunctional histidinol dehydrogenase [Lobosporangium transversale]ORZ26688.1 histidinol dehydrogenase-domain-containing protein [Lobosporangium transversale]|eukprot:XP_021884451.1 histidinol dehydrogenase-domain-containing protein [Lobosporangium transversale]
MILPRIDLAADDYATTLKQFSLLPNQILITPTPDDSRLQNILKNQNKDAYWVQPLAFDQNDPLAQIHSLLDSGSDKVILPYAAFAAGLDAYSHIPQERLAVTLNPAEFNKADHLLNTVSVFILNVDTTESLEAIKAVAQVVQKSLLPRGGVKRVIAAFSAVPGQPSVPANTPGLLAISELGRIGVDTSLSTDVLSIDHQDGKLNLGEAFMATIVSDRPDGLFPTIVVDEQGISLGLVYSSLESVVESFRIRQGVYFSRSRGLWHKGATSGATQDLIKVHVDCDSDALQFTVHQHGAGFCHNNIRGCFGPSSGLAHLNQTLQSRKLSAPAGSYTQRLFKDSNLVKSKIMEEAEELCEAKTPEEIAWETADLIYFALVKCVANGVTLRDVEQQLENRSRKITRRPGNAKPKWDVRAKEAAATETPATAPAPTPVPTQNGKENVRIAMKSYKMNALSADDQRKLLLRPIIQSNDIMARVKPIVDSVRQSGDAALLELTAKFDGVQLDKTVISAPFTPESMVLDEQTRRAIDQAYDNIQKFHAAQLQEKALVVETMPGVVCTRFARPIERVGLYVPGGTAVLPSTTLMLGIPAAVAGCKEIVIATPPRKDGSIVPEVMYVAHKVGASKVLMAGGAQAVAAMAYGTESCPKVDKICGPGNQYVTAAKMLTQIDSSSLVSIDMPAGPSELLVIADMTSIPAYVASDLLSQAEHGTDSQVVLIAVGLTPEHLAAIEDQVHEQASRLPRVDIVRESIPKSFIIEVETMEEAMRFSNEYAPEHLILHLEQAETHVEKVMNAGSVFVGHWSPESCGDYASGTNHTLPTYGYARMYSGVNTDTFLKHITSQQLTREGLDAIGDTVMRLAEIEGLEAHRNAVAVRINDIRQGRS